MKFIEFTKRFGDEAACKEYFKEFRLKQGLKCSKCGANNFHWLEDYDRWQCRSCHKQKTLRGGTLLESSHLPYHYWIYAIYLMTNTKKGISALEMQRQLGHKRYDPIWYMMHKIRRAMGNRDDKYQLDKIVEFDDAFVKASSDDKEDDTYGKRRGRGTLGKAPIVLMASTAPGDPLVAQKSNKKPSRLRFIKMKVVEGQKSEDFEEKVEKHVKSNAELRTDGFKAYSKLKKYVQKHLAESIAPEEAGIKLPWVHTTVSNLKRQLLGIHHNIKDIYLQNYLNEFCYKTNRRYYSEQLFDRVMVAAVEQAWYGAKKPT
jgi:transposase-like protein